MLYWMHDETGRVLCTEDGYYPGDLWFEISSEDYEAASHPLSPLRKIEEDDKETR